MGGEARLILYIFQSGDWTDPPFWEWDDPDQRSGERVCLGLILCCVRLFGRIYPGAKVSRSPCCPRVSCVHGLSSSLMALMPRWTCLFLQRCRLPAGYKHAMHIWLGRRDSVSIYTSPRGETMSKIICIRPPKHDQIPFCR